jgi:hypothetical protein
MISQTDAPLRLSLFNLIGKRVMPERMVQAGEAIDISNLPNGLYLVEVRTGPQQRKVTRLQVSR